MIYGNAIDNYVIVQLFLDEYESWMMQHTQTDSVCVVCGTTDYVYLLLTL